MVSTAGRYGLLTIADSFFFDFVLDSDFFCLKFSLLGFGV